MRRIAYSLSAMTLSSVAGLYAAEPPPPAAAPKSAVVHADGREQKGAVVQAVVNADSPYQAKGEITLVNANMANMSVTASEPVYVPNGHNGYGHNGHGVIVNGDYRCGNGCVANGYGNGCTDGYGRRWAAGAGILYIQPRWEDDAGFRVIDAGAINALFPEVPEGSDLETVLALITDNLGDLTHAFDYTGAGKVWLGYSVGCGYGLRSSFWTLSADNSAAVAVEELTPESEFDFSGFLESELKMHVWDVEATKEYGHSCWSALASAGIRYASLRQEFDLVSDFNQITTEGTETTVNATGILDMSHASRFRGLGPTAALELRRRMGSTAFSIYGNIRGSVLVGINKRTGSADVVLDLDTEGTSEFHLDRRDSKDNVIPVGEFETGLEWSTCCNGSNLFFVQVALVGQKWGDAGSSFRIPSEDGPWAALGTGGYLELFGLHVSAGFVY